MHLFIVVSREQRFPDRSYQQETYFVAKVFGHIPAVPGEPFVEPIAKEESDVDAETAVTKALRQLSWHISRNEDPEKK